MCCLITQRSCHSKHSVHLRGIKKKSVRCVRPTDSGHVSRGCVSCWGDSKISKKCTQATIQFREDSLYHEKFDAIQLFVYRRHSFSITKYNQPNLQKHHCLPSNEMESKKYLLFEHFMPHGKEEDNFRTTCHCAYYLGTVRRKMLLITEALC